MTILGQALSNSLKEYENLERKLRASYDESKNSLDDLSKYLNRIESGNLLYKEAIIRIIEKNREAFYNLLYEEAISAAVNSGEFNYGPYLDRLSESIQLADIAVKLRGKNLDIDIDLSPLGDIRDWGNAVKKVRRNPRNLINRQKKIGGENLARFYWRTKIYQTAKYDQTIADQLSLVKGAPFWYLIEHGNANPPGFQVVAPAYPRVKRSGFVEKTARRIRLYIQDQIKIILPEIESEWVEIISKSLGKPLTPKLKQAIEESKNTIALYINNLETAPKLKTNDVIARITTIDKEFNIIVTSKSLGLRTTEIGKRK